VVPAIALATRQTRHSKRRVRNIGYKKSIIEVRAITVGGATGVSPVPPTV